MTVDARAVARGAGKNLLAALGGLLQPVFLLVAASLYGAEAFGLYMIGYAIVDLSSKAATFGFDKALMRFLPLSSHDKAAKVAVVCTALRGTLLASGLLTFGLVLAAGLLARFFHHDALGSVIRLLAPAVIGAALVGL